MRRRARGRDSRCDRHRQRLPLPPGRVLLFLPFPVQLSDDTTMAIPSFSARFHSLHRLLVLLERATDWSCCRCYLITYTTSHMEALPRGPLGLCIIRKASFSRSTQRGGGWGWNEDGLDFAAIVYISFAPRCLFQRGRWREAGGVSLSEGRPDHVGLFHSFDFAAGVLECTSAACVLADLKSAIREKWFEGCPLMHSRL